MHQDFAAGAAGAQSDLGFISLRNLLFCSCSSVMVRFSMVKYILQAGRFPSAVQLINFYVYNASCKTCHESLPSPEGDMLRLQISARGN